MSFNPRSNNGQVSIGLCVYNQEVRFLNRKRYVTHYTVQKNTCINSRLAETQFPGGRKLPGR
jgi:hypothetical protein